MASRLVLKQTPKVPAEDSAAFGAIAERFRRGGALERAVSLCREGLSRYPDHVSARVTLGWALLDLGQLDDARVELEQALRRAPDNLAAIRGLAELHDRFEQTLHLPMDGPGQWPPPPAAVDEVDAFVSAAPRPAATVPTAQAGDGVMDLFAAEAPDDADVEAAVLPPAELGLPIWTPSQAGAPADAAPAAGPTSTLPAASGMSSVREIGLQQGAIALDLALDGTAEAARAATARLGAEAEYGLQGDLPVGPAREPVAAASDMAAPSVPDAIAAGEFEVSDSQIAALLAEADALEAVAEAEALEVSADLSFRMPGESDAEGAARLARPLVDATASIPAPVEPAFRSVPEVGAPMLAEDAANIPADVGVLTGPAGCSDPLLETAAPAGIEEPGFELVPPPSLACHEGTLDISASEGAASRGEAWRNDEPALDFGTEVTPETPVVLPFVAALEVAPVGASPSRAHLALARLEDMLVRVQARRRQLMAQSVA